ncbi:MAG: Na+/H+ antiporter subunit C [Alphaproteobacteria bacterium]|nr:MAG: Na+/H+ antiporter subunit C [Alphaproteobacteria bacterium]
MVGLYTVMSRTNLIKKMIGLSLFQISVFLFYISMGKIAGGTAPILIDPAPGAAPIVYSNPLPHVLILTAIVVGVATTALGLSLVVRIKESFGTIDEEDILKLEDEA